MNLQFGSGVLYALPNAGNLAANPTPYKFGVLQESSVEFKGDIKKLFGQQQFPVAKARGKIDVSGKAKLAVIDVGMLNQLYFGQTSAAGVTQLAVDEAQNVPAVATFIVTATNHTTFVTDYGVNYASNGQQFVKLASGTPAVGQYTCAAGVYTFAAADEGVAVLLAYSYTTAARGVTISLTNQFMGYAPVFRAFMFDNFNNKLFGLELNSCMMASISLPTKQEDFWMVDIAFDASVDASNALGQICADIA